MDIQEILCCNLAIGLREIFTVCKCAYPSSSERTISIPVMCDMYDIINHLTPIKQKTPNFNFILVETCQVSTTKFQLFDIGCLSVIFELSVTVSYRMLLQWVLHGGVVTALDQQPYIFCYSIHSYKPVKYSIQIYKVLSIV